MDQTVINALASAGINYEFKTTGIIIPILVNEKMEPVPLVNEICVKWYTSVLPDLCLKKISELWVGSKQPPSFLHGPPKEYVMFFNLIEQTAIDFCTSTQRIERDVEIERLYNLLRRRPDNRDPNPLFSYLQAAVRLYMSIRDVSQAEFEAVASRLARSAKTFSQGPSSRNYVDIVGKSLRGEL